MVKEQRGYRFLLKEFASATVVASILWNPSCQKRSPALLIDSSVGGPGPIIVEFDVPLLTCEQSVVWLREGQGVMSILTFRMMEVGG